MRIFLSFLLIPLHFLSANDDLQDVTLFSLDAEPSSVVNGSVNVISGEYCESHVDLVLPGPTPIVIERSYTSGNRASGNLALCWNYNHRMTGKLERYLTIYGWDGFQFNSYGLENAIFFGKAQKKDHFSELGIKKDKFVKGAVNTSSGAMSGRTNPLNSKVMYRPNGMVCKMELPDGRVRHFKARHDNIDDFYLTREIQPEKNALVYEWHKKNDFYELLKIAACSQDNLEFGSVLLHHRNHNKEFSIEASNSDYVRYCLSHDHVRWTEKKMFILKDVKSYHSPPVHYTYRHKSHQIKRREHPEKRFLEIEYYDEGENRVGKKKVTIDSKEDPRIGRVKVQRAPVGLDDRSIITHRYFYKLDSKIKNNKIEIKSGSVDVLDAYDHKTTYRFGKDLRLSSLEKFDENRVLYSKERLFWSDEQEVDRTRLISRAFEDQQGKVHCFRHFVYDDRGNILEDQFFGNLTGTSQENVVISKTGVNQNPNVECFTKYYRYNLRNLMTEVVEGDKSIHYTYDPEKDLLLSKLTADRGTIVHREFYEYDENGVNIKKIVDNGSTIYKENLKGVTTRLIEITCPTTSTPVGLPAAQEERYLDLQTGKEHLIKRFENTFDSFGNVILQKIYDCHNDFAFELTFTYDTHGNLIEETNPLGQLTFRRYDANNNLIFEQGPCPDFYKEFVYDYSNRLIREEVIFADGNREATSYAYDYLSNRTKSVDRFGNETRYSYDCFGRLIQVNEPDGYIKKKSYNLLSQPIETVEPDGGKTKTSFTLRGQPVHVIYEDGSCESFEYALDGSLVKQVSKNGSYVLLKHDIFGNITEKAYFSDLGEFLYSTSATYDAFHLLSETDAAGFVSEYVYDSAGRLVEKLGKNQRTHFEYDSLNRLYKTIDFYDDSDAKVFVQERNNLNQIIEERTENLQGETLKKIQYAYDEIGHQTEKMIETSAGLAISKTVFNYHGQPLLEIDPEGKETFYVYESQGASSSVDRIDCTGKIVHTEFDAHGQAIFIETKNPIGEVVQREVSHFDLAGNKIKNVIDVISKDNTIKTQITEWTFDAGQREIECRQAVGTPLERSTKKTYNKAGELETIVKPNGVILTHMYDSQGKLTRLSSSDHTIHYVYLYNSLGQMILSQDLVHQRSSCRTYDEKGYLKTETLATGYTTMYTRDNSGRITETTLPDGSTIEYFYDACYLRRVQRNSLTHNFEAYDLSGHLLKEKGPLGQTTTQYDLMRRTLSIKAPCWQEENLCYDVNGNLLSTTKQKVQCQFTYDDLDQLLEESGAQNHTYAFDSINNRLEKDGVKHKINALNQLLFDGEFHYIYDKNGNLIEKRKGETVIQFTYDALDRLISVSTPSLQVFYTYDETGRRLTKTSTHNKTTKQEIYLYQGDNEVGKCNTQGEIVELRILGLGKGGEIGGSVFFEFDGSTYLPVHDHNGNVVSLMNEKGDVVENYSYSSFGEEIDSKPSINPWHFASKRVDLETGFIFFGKRYYDPSTGRWVTQDPLGYADGPNLYAYVRNNPLTHIDPFGLAKLSNVYKFFCNLLANDAVREMAGGALALIGDHVIPVPFVRDAFSYGGRWLASGTVGFYIREEFSPRPKIGSVKTPELGQREAVGFVNGIMNNVYGVMGTSMMISHSHGGTNVHYMWNASHGFVFDLIRALMHKLYLPTESVVKTTSMIRSLIDDVGGVGNGGRVDLYAHSHGGAILNAAIKHLSPEEKKMLYVVTLGSATMISSHGLGECINYVSCNDPVPFVTDSAGIMLGKMGCGGYNIRIIPSKGTPFMDHSIEGDTYRGVIERRGMRFKARNGIQ